VRWAALARRAAVVALAASSVTVVAGSQAAGSGTGAGTMPVRAAAVGALPPPAAPRSVRSYDDVAEPVRLRIPALRIDTPLVTLHRAADGSVEVPTDFNVAGWFADGPRPGQPGPAVILGHVDSRAGPAVFFRLKDLPAGAEAVVDRADGSAVAFRVRGSMRVPKVDFPTDAVYGPTLEPSLRLVTCGGSFDRTARSYRDNVIVYADPAG
jgi:Sortase domain